MDQRDAALQADDIEAFADRHGTSEAFDWWSCVNDFMSASDPAAVRARYVRQLSSS